MPHAPPPSGSLKFQGRRDWPPDPQPDDWGLTWEQQETYVERFRMLLDTNKAWNEEKDDFYKLRRFLRARCYDLERAKDMWLAHVKWKKDWGVETILQDFQFHERDGFMECYPQGYHKVDKLGRPVYIQQIGKIDVPKLHTISDDERMIKFHIQEYERCGKVILPICSRLANRNIETTFGIMDVKGVGLGHLTGEVKRLMSLVTKYDQDNYPEMLGHICIINAPTVFRMVWRVVKNMIDARTQSKIEILGTNYLEFVLKWVDIENLPDWLGGKSHGSLQDDVGPWNDAELVASLGLDVEELRHGKRPPPLLAATSNRHPQLTVIGRASSELSDGFQSPTASSGELGHIPSFNRVHTGSRTNGTVDHLPGILLSLSHRQQNGFPAIPEGSPSHAQHSRTLVARISALEKFVQDMPAGTNGIAHASSAAPPGSLLHRVEVLEGAMEAVMAAQQAVLENQRQLRAAPPQHDQPSVSQQHLPPKARQCCCVVM